MPPRGFTNPPPKTESAREAAKAFFCDLCQKGYARQNEYAAHEASYDHQHKQRLKDLKAMNRVMENSAVKARKAEDESTGAGLVKIQPIALKSAGGGAGGGFKKGGFKSAFVKAGDEQKERESAGGVKTEVKVEVNEMGVVEVKRVVVGTGGEEVSDDEEGYELYDPRRPTDCPVDCRGRH